MASFSFKKQKTTTTEHVDKETVQQSLEGRNILERNRALVEWGTPFRLDSGTQTPKLCLNLLPTRSGANVSIVWRTREEPLEWFADAYPAEGQTWASFQWKRLRLPDEHYIELHERQREINRQALAQIEVQLTDHQRRLAELQHAHPTLSVENARASLSENTFCYHSLSRMLRYPTRRQCIEAAEQKLLENKSIAPTPYGSEEALAAVTTLGPFAQAYEAFSGDVPLGLLERIRVVERKLAELHSSGHARFGSKWVWCVDEKRGEQLYREWQTRFCRSTDEKERRTILSVYIQEELNDRLKLWRDDSLSKLWTDHCTQLRAAKTQPNAYQLYQSFCTTSLWVTTLAQCKISSMKSMLQRYLKCNGQTDGAKRLRLCMSITSLFQNIQRETIDKPSMPLEAEWIRLLCTWVVLPTDDRTLHSVLEEQQRRPDLYRVQDESTVRIRVDGVEWPLVNVRGWRPNRVPEFIRMNWNEFRDPRGFYLGQWITAYDQVKDLALYPTAQQLANAFRNGGPVLDRMKLFWNSVQALDQQKRQTLDPRHAELTRHVDLATVLKEARSRDQTQITQALGGTADLVCFKTAREAFSATTALCVEMAQRLVPVSLQAMVKALLTRISEWEWKRVMQYRSLSSFEPHQPHPSLSRELTEELSVALPRIDFQHEILRNHILPPEYLMAHVLGPLVQHHVLIQHHGRWKTKFEGQKISTREVGWGLNHLGLSAIALRVLDDIGQQTQHRFAQQGNVQYLALRDCIYAVETRVMPHYHRSHSFLRERIRQVDEYEYHETKASANASLTSRAQFTWNQLSNKHLFPPLDSSFRTRLQEWWLIRAWAEIQPAQKKLVLEDWLSLRPVFQQLTLAHLFNVRQSPKLLCLIVAYYYR